MGDSDSTGTTETGRGWNALVTHVSTHKIELALWGTRIATIVFTLGYFLPFFGNPYSAYHKALMANAATSALRLHQRLPQVQFTQEFLGILLKEDSCHYLFYSIIFLYAAPITLVLLPVLLFAVLHSASYSLTLLDTLGQNSWWGARMLISLIEFQSRNILRMVAFTEICLMPFTVIMIFVGRTSLLTPFIYYRFLELRYASRRNPYTRTMFHELRLTIEAIIDRPGTPAGIRNLVKKIIDLISHFAPVLPQSQ